MLACVAGICHLLTIAALTIHPVSNPKSRTTVLNFDDLVTKNGFADIPSPYSYLNFSTFSVFSPKDPALSKFITENDLNCAVSSPNALLGSRLYERGAPAAFEIANASSMVADGLQPYFALLSFYIKPMDAPPPGVTIFVRGHSYIQEPVEWHVDFPSGYHLPFLVNIGKFSGLSWTYLRRIEIWANFGEDALDWEFCLDILEIQFDPRLAEELRPHNSELMKSGTWIAHAALRLFWLLQPWR
ncbi:hypothetical protein MMC30_008045 [Trapelia coarctata]|nr:hypothetical protein [Trapelia coarctata]